MESLLDMVTHFRKSDDFSQFRFPSGTSEQLFYQGLDSSYCVSSPLCLRRMKHWDLIFGIKYFPMSELHFTALMPFTGHVLYAGEI